MTADIITLCEIPAPVYFKDKEERGIIKKMNDMKERINPLAHKTIRRPWRIY